MMSEKLCRTCLQKTDRFEELGYGHDSLKSRLLYCVPKIDWTIISTPVMCNECIHSLSVTFRFLQMCMKTEEKLHSIGDIKRLKRKRKGLDFERELTLKKHQTADFDSQLRLLLQTTSGSPKMVGEIQKNHAKTNGKDASKIGGTETEQVAGTASNLNKGIDYILSTCEKPFILLPNELPVNGSTLAICKPAQKQNVTCPIITGDIETIITQVNKVVQKHSSLQDDQDLSLESLLYKEKLSCKLCSKQFSRVENLRFHEKMHTNTSLLLCNTCAETFSDTDALMKHVALHEKKTSNDLEECELCGKLVHKRCLPEHENLHLKQNRFDCRFCCKSFPKKGLFVYHLRTHTDAEKRSVPKPTVSSCDTCEKDTSRPLHDDASIKTSTAANNTVSKGKLDGTAVLRLPTVLEMQSTSTRVKQGTKPGRKQTKHMSNVNFVREKSFRANGGGTLCMVAQENMENTSTAFHRSDDAETIIVSDDSSDSCQQVVDDLPSNRLQQLSVRLSSCEICLKTFVNRPFFERHCEQHLELQCRDCCRYFFTIHAILQHEEHEHKFQLFQCTKCDTFVIQKENFIRHIMSHDTQKTTCKVCYYYLMQRHAESSSKFHVFIGRDTFQCDICGKLLQFTDFLDLRCNICNKQFPNELSLKEHEQDYRLSSIKCFSCGKYFHCSNDLEKHTCISDNCHQVK